MDTRYILPATVAAAIHAIALFGFNPPRALPPTPGTEPAGTLPPPEEIIKICDVEDPPIAADEASVPGPKGDPEIVRPGADEPEPRMKPEITFPPLPKGPRIESGRIIPPGIPGWKEGGDGPRSGVPVADFRLLDETPRVKARVSPLYPSELKTAGISGEVLVGFLVDESGRVLRAWAVRSTDRRFEDTTLRAVSGWRFTPGKRDGKPVRFRMEVPVRFALSE